MFCVCCIVQYIHVLYNTTHARIVQYIHVHGMYDTTGVLQGLSSDLKQSPTVLEELKHVLSVISQIRAMSLEVEMRTRDIVERYRTLAMYSIPVTKEEEELVGSIEQRWTDVFHEAKMLDRSLVAVKKKFTLVSVINDTLTHHHNRSLSLLSPSLPLSSRSQKMMSPNSSKKPLISMNGSRQRVQPL